MRSRQVLKNWELLTEEGKTDQERVRDLSEPQSKFVSAEPGLQLLVSHLKLFLDAVVAWRSIFELGGG